MEVKDEKIVCGVKLNLVELHLIEFYEKNKQFSAF
jgi:hypothetical protein